MAHKITILLFCGVLFLAVTKISAADPAVKIAPDQPRNPASFAALFAKSPFAMSTVGNDSPISQRYVITGAMMIDETPNVFLLDKKTQDRLMISTGHPDEGVSLVSLQKDADVSLVRATIRVGGDTGVVAFEKAPDTTATAQASPTPGDTANTQSTSAADADKPKTTASAAPDIEASSDDLPARPARRTIHRQAPALPSAMQPSQPTS